MAKDMKKARLPKSTLIIRLIAGFYLVYLAYELFTGLQVENGAPVWLAEAAGAVFAICGAVLVFVSAKAFLKGDFEGGILDQSEKGQDSQKEEESL